MKIVSVVGARPQFIKAAAVSRVIREYAEEILVHTGQHYDANMSDIFFEELSIPKPDYYLGVGSGTHARQTADMLIKLEELYLKEQPDYVLVYGDTNSTLAGALAASKILIPVIHVEAGLRSFNMAMPEEQNRIMADHISKYLFCPSQTAVDNLYRENVKENVFNIGDVMCDAVRFYVKKIENKKRDEFIHKPVFLYNWAKTLDKWYIATVHRTENTEDEKALSEILKAFERLDFPVIFPVHPRIKKYVDQLMYVNQYKNIAFIEPLGYLDMLFFTGNAVKVVTDSGGLQKEAYMMHRNVVTLRDQTEWIETLEENHNILCPIDSESILENIQRSVAENGFNDSLYGDGDAANKMCRILFT